MGKPPFFWPIPGKSQNTRKHAAEVKGKAGCCMETPFWLNPWKKPEYPEACCRDEWRAGCCMETPFLAYSWKKPEYPAACCRDEGQGGDVYSVDQVRGELCELMLQSRLFSCLEFYLAAFRLLKTQSHLSLNQTNVSVLRS